MSITVRGEHLTMRGMGVRDTWLAPLIDEQARTPVRKRDRSELIAENQPEMPWDMPAPRVSERALQDAINAEREDD